MRFVAPARCRDTRASGVQQNLLDRQTLAVERGEFGLWGTQEIDLPGTVTRGHGLQMGFDFQPIFLDSAAILMSNKSLRLEIVALIITGPVPPSTK